MSAARFDQPNRVDLIAVAVAALGVALLRVGRRLR